MEGELQNKTMGPLLRRILLYMRFSSFTKEQRKELAKAYINEINYPVNFQRGMSGFIQYLEKRENKRASDPEIRSMPEIHRVFMPQADFFSPFHCVKPWKREISWEKSATSRRGLFLVLTLAMGIFASNGIIYVLSGHGIKGINLFLSMIFTVLFIWIAAYFWIAWFGFLSLLKRRELYDLDIEDQQNLGEDAMTAITIPICNEDVREVFARLRSIYKSIQSTGEIRRFRFFILSDTTKPEILLEEEEGWFKICQELRGEGTIFYRRRKVRIRHKNGNIVDFCKRWGRQFKYMLLLDADSLMEGPLVIKLLKIMESRPDIGILQTVPRGIMQNSLFGRIQQFASHTYLEIYIAGLHYLQLGDAAFWGHNAMIRIEPYMKYCKLPDLKGLFSFGGKILSHDFVEAALMRRAGLGIWLLNKSYGSFEEPPFSLSEELRRDKRWCKGNMQHLKLIFMRKIRMAHRVLFMNGIMFYLSSFLWFLLLVLVAAELVLQTFIPPDYFPFGKSLFPRWPEQHHLLSGVILAFTFILLITPKVLGFLNLVLQGNLKYRFGGGGKLFLSTFLEGIFSICLAPLKMLSHTKYVIMSFLGTDIRWRAEKRDKDTTLWEACKIHWFGTLLGILWAVYLYCLNKAYFCWFTPVFIPLIISIPFSVLSSLSSLGNLTRKAGLFLIPNELNPLETELEYQKEISKNDNTISYLKRMKGLRKVIMDPQSLKYHRCFISAHRRFSSRLQLQLRNIEKKIFKEGPESLSTGESLMILNARECLDRLHQQVWSLTDREFYPHWLRAV